MKKSDSLYGKFYNLQEDPQGFGIAGFALTSRIHNMKRYMRLGKADKAAEMARRAAHQALAILRAREGT